jgi:hypothetical protein
MQHRHCSLMVGPRCRRYRWAVAARASILGLAFLWLVGPAAAQNSWQGLHPVNTLDFWSNAGEWSLGTVPDGSTDINIGFDDVGGDTSFTNRHTLTIDGQARLIVFSPTTITNSGTSAFINNSGTLLNNGTITNASSGTHNNIGVLSNNGTVFNELGAQLNNDLELDNNGTFVNRLSGTIVNTGNLNNNSGGLLTNDLSSTITNNNLINASGGKVSNFAALNGTGTVTNLGRRGHSQQETPYKALAWLACDSLKKPIERQKPGQGFKLTATCHLSRLYKTEIWPF